MSFSRFTNPFRQETIDNRLYDPVDSEPINIYGKKELEEPDLIPFTQKLQNFTDAGKFAKNTQRLQRLQKQSYFSKLREHAQSMKQAELQEKLKLEMAQALPQKPKRSRPQPQPQLQTQPQWQPQQPNRITDFSSIEDQLKRRVQDYVNIQQWEDNPFNVRNDEAYDKNPWGYRGDYPSKVKEFMSTIRHHSQHPTEFPKRVARGDFSTIEKSPNTVKRSLNRFFP